MLARGKREFVALFVSWALVVVPARGGQSPASSSPTTNSDPKKAKKAYALAQQAEQAEDWPKAFALYSEAVAYMPENGQYLLRREATRFQVVQQHVDRAERAAVAGRLEEARGELRAALALDPSYTLAQERLQQLAPAAQGPSPAAEYVAGPAQLRPQPGKRSFDYRGDTRGAYEEAARQFGLIATFDPDLRPRQITFRVADVDFETTLRLLGQQTRTFWRALDERTFLVADDTPQKRRELEPSVARTVTLAGLATPEQMTELVRLVREIAGINRTQLDTRTRTLTMRASPEAIALAVKLIEDLEQALGELLLEIDILEVDRQAARQLGITPPTSARLFAVSPEDVREAQQSPEALLRVLQRIFGMPALTGFPGAAPSGLGPLIPPLVAFGGGRTIFFATLPGAAAEFAEAFSVLRRARRMLLRAQDGQPATFFIGERFPIALAVLQPNFASALAAGISPGSFPRIDLTARDGPIAVTTGDVNSDSRADLAVANANDDSVSIFPGNGDGTFATRSDFSAGTLPSSVALGDFNADARLDLAVANEGSDNVSILLQNAAGGFDPKTDFTTGLAPRAVIAADFNGDARLDLAVANSGSDSVSILLGNGDGTFAPKTDFAVGMAPHAIVAGNFNAGSVTDLAVANENSDSVSILLGNGDGTFALLADFTTGDAPVAVATADFNADALADLALANLESDTVSILLGNGDGTFGAGTEFTASDGPAGVATGDFNTDGRQDLAVANLNSDTVTILLGTGDGGFGLRADFATGDGPVAVTTADFNADGRRDLAITNRDADTLSVILNQTVFAPPGAVFSPQSVTPYPGFQYEDLGLKVRATPRLHAGNEVTLQLQIEIRSRTGQTINTVPVISNRTLEQTVRLRENEPTLLTGLIQREERQGISGWPGLARAPVAGHLAGARDKEKRESELLIVITPRRIRLAERVDRLLYAGRERGPTTGGVAPP